MEEVIIRLNIVTHEVLITAPSHLPVQYSPDEISIAGMVVYFRLQYNLKIEERGAVGRRGQRLSKKSACTLSGWLGRGHLQTPQA
jgi:hypothetical protein